MAIRKVLLTTLTLLISLNAKAETLKYKWINDSQDGEPIALSESEAYLVTISTNQNHKDHIYFYSRRKGDDFCVKTPKALEQVNSVKFNNTLVKMYHACNERNEHYYFPATDAGYRYIINQLGTKDVVYLTASDTGKTFDKITTSGFNTAFQKYLKQIKDIAGGI